MKLRHSPSARDALVRLGKAWQGLLLLFDKPSEPYQASIGLESLRLCPKAQTEALEKPNEAWQASIRLVKGQKQALPSLAKSCQASLGHPAQKANDGGSCGTPLGPVSQSNSHENRSLPAHVFGAGGEESIFMGFALGAGPEGVPEPQKRASKLLKRPLPYAISLFLSFR